MDFLQPKAYNFDTIVGMSYSQLNQHYTLYTRYVDTTNKIALNIDNDKLYENCNSNFSNLRNVQIALSFNLDGVKLHELYFENMTGLNTNINGPIHEIIKQNFGTYENFLDKFKCIAMSMRGWAIFCYDSFTNSYYLYGQDSHNTQVVVNTYPIIVLDVYEHAYMIDFGINKKQYVDLFFENLDFRVVNNRIKMLSRCF